MIEEIAALQVPKRIIIDPVESNPPHALTRQEIWALFRSLPEEWDTRVRIVHLKATLPEHSRFARPVIYSSYSARLNVCSRGLPFKTALREILRELAIEGTEFRHRERVGSRLSRHDLEYVDHFVEPILNRVLREIMELPAEKLFSLETL